MLFKKKIKCPYCNEILEKKPAKKTKCPFCKNYIFVRSQRLVTEERAKIIDALKRLQIPEKDFDSYKNNKVKKLNYEPNYVDLLKDFFEDHIKKIKDLDLLSSKYYSMAIVMNENEHDSFYYLQGAARSKLKSIKKEGYCEEVELTGGECPSCQQLKGKVFKIDEALKIMPIPNKSCTYIMHDKKRGFCRCLYYPSSEEAREISKKYR